MNNRIPARADMIATVEGGFRDEKSGECDHFER